MLFSHTVYNNYHLTLSSTDIDISARPDQELGQQVFLTGCQRHLQCIPPQPVPPVQVSSARQDSAQDVVAHAPVVVPEHLCKSLVLCEDVERGDGVGAGDGVDVGAVRHEEADEAGDMVIVAATGLKGY